MSQTAGEPRTAPRRLAALYAPIREELARVEEILRQELHSQYPFLDELVKHGFRIGGKRLRPALVLMAGKLCGRLGPDHLRLAAGVEMIHTATLIHDDVLDEATIRRHLQTANARWDNEASVLLGDYLFAHAICIITRLDDLFAVRAIGDATKTVCEGELRQVATRGNYELSEQEYLEIIEGKTAALTACCCLLGAHFSGAASEVGDALSRFGRDLGIAFQIADDLLDVMGSETTAGKSLGTDLAKQKPTLPLIRLWSVASESERRQLRAILDRRDNHHRRALAPWFARFGAIDYARDAAHRYARQAVGQLDGLPPSPMRESLAELTEYAVSRQA